MAEETGLTAAMRAQIALRERILAGDFAPGTRLLEVTLAEDLQISRTPVRDALARLAEEGLLDRARGGGFLVRSCALADVMDALEIRGVLEGTAARLAAERGIDDSARAGLDARLAVLESAFDPAGPSVDLAAYARANAAFHDLLWHLAGSAILLRELERAARLPFASPSAFLHERNRDAAFRLSLFTAQDQHRALAEAIAAREGARAEAIAREHARLARRNLALALEAGAEAIRAVPGLALVTR